MRHQLLKKIMNLNIGPKALRDHALDGKVKKKAGQDCVIGNGLPIGKRPIMLLL